MVSGANGAALAAATARSHGAARTPRLLIALLAVGLIAPGVACPGGGDVAPRDCINPFGGTELCGPPWDRDNDTISTATETNPTNRIGNVPISGFYTFDTLRWDLNRSIAHGDTTSGSLDDGMNLRDDSTGYTHSIYRGCDGVDVDDWGTGHLLRLIEGSGRDWAYYRSPFTRPRMQTGDMSLRNGDVFATCGDPHAWHRNGLDVDVHYLGKDGYEGPLNICDPNPPAPYDPAATSDLFDTIVFLNGDGQDGRPYVEFILADTTCLGFVNYPDDPYIRHNAGHRDHFHVRIRDPDGPNN